MRAALSGVGIAARRPSVALASPVIAVLVLTAACAGLVGRGEPAAVRQAAPAFTLSSHDGRTVALDDLLARGPALVVFYRGHW